ncbi:hypothetical protein GCM10022226_61510 [Sphaerisporangium flaviroseum]|uniref:Uncharacterized protein n=1 Tax=Sphaerisporangium flaviroseum TaxID=509199 RepID=A0ABP7J159_9ACTN
MKALTVTLAATCLALASAAPSSPATTGQDQAAIETATARPADAALAAGPPGQRACWYEPGPDAAAMLTRQRHTRAWYIHTSPSGTWDQHLRQFTDKIGKKGRWWTPAYNTADPQGLSCWTALSGAVWAPAGTTPPGGRP